jgi:hypothetical protein
MECQDGYNAMKKKLDCSIVVKSNLGFDSEKSLSY